MVGRDRQAGQPAAAEHERREADRAQAAHADLGEPAARLQPAGHGAAAVDQPRAPGQRGHGDAGDEAGAGLRRGLIAIAGRTGDAAGLSAPAGTIVAFGALGSYPGAGMRRASIVAMGAVALLPSYAPAVTYRPPFLRLLLRRLRELGLPVTDEQIDGRYTRWSGDGLELGRGG